jgi:iron-sulfur cluster repair protein YtfE (RIC family)
MPNVIEVLTQQHREAEQMLTQLKGTGGENVTLLETAGQDLRIHMKLEEDLLYPFLRKNITNGNELMTEANKEHEEAKEALAKVETSTGAAFEQALETLTEGVLHHVEEEEGEIFPKMRESIDQAKLEEFGQEVLTNYEQLKSEGWTGKSEGKTRDELYAEAKEVGIEGRSKMNKDELADAVEQSS